MKPNDSSRLTMLADLLAWVALQLSGWPGKRAASVRVGGRMIGAIAHELRTLAKRGA